MPTPTYTLIDSTTLTSAATSVTFSSISATGKGDLVLMIDGINGLGTSGPVLRFNSDTSNNYYWVTMSGSGAAYQSQSQNSSVLSIGDLADLTTSSRSSYIVQINDFSATDKHKSTLTRSNNAALGVDAFAGRWASTSALTTIEVSIGGTNNFDVGSTFHLYQIVSE